MKTKTKLKLKNNWKTETKTKTKKTNQNENHTGRLPIWLVPCWTSYLHNRGETAMTRYIARHLHNMVGDILRDTHPSQTGSISPTAVLSRAL